MSPRERMMATALLAGILVAAGAFLFYELYLVPLGDREATLVQTQTAIDNLKAHAKKVEDLKQKLEPWSKLSLPGDKTFSQLRYGTFLNEMMARCHLAGIEVKAAGDTSDVRTGPPLPTLDKKEAPAYKALNYTVKGHGDLMQIVQFLEEFYRTPLLHKIKTLTIQRAKASALGGTHVKGGAMVRKEDLDIDMKVEAIILTGAENRPELLPKGATAHVLARTSRDYQAITGKDPFYPPPPPLQKQDGPDPSRSIRLTLITHDDQDGCKAVLYDQDNKSICYLCPKTGHVRFLIRGKPGPFELVQIDKAGRKIVFSADDKLYELPLDHTVYEALGRPLSVAQVRALELTKVDSNNSPR